MLILCAYYHVSIIVFITIIVVVVDYVSIIAFVTVVVAGHCWYSCADKANMRILYFLREQCIKQVLQSGASLLQMTYADFLTFQ